MRLDKFLSTVGAATRREASKSIRSGKVSVNGEVCRSSDGRVDPETDVVEYAGRRIVWRRNVYIMLNKPAGYVSSTEDSPNTVMKLIKQEDSKKGLFPCGRLDIDVEGLLIITDDGATSHALLSPKRHVEKEYYFECSSPLSDEDVKKFESGIELSDFTAKPAVVRADESRTKGAIIITEGKYHQIKRMFHAVSNNIDYLKRIRFGKILLDENLKPGEYRYLTDEEIEILKSGES